LEPEEDIYGPEGKCWRTSATASERVLQSPSRVQMASDIRNSEGANGKAGYLSAAREIRENVCPYGE